MDSPLEVPVQKLGHPVLEVRTWALFSLLSKLECELISLQELTENDDVIGKLVQWMKHDKCSQRDKILELLRNLVEHSTKNIERLLSFDPELLSLKRLQKLDQHQETVTHIINKIAQSGIRREVSSVNVLEMHWSETNRTDFESLFTTYRLPLDSISDPDIQVLTQWELAFESEDSLSQHKASADFTSLLIQDFHVQSFLQHSNFTKIILKKLNDVSSINTVKQVLGCLNSCVSDIEEQIRLRQLLVPSDNTNLSYCRVTVPFFYLSLLDSLLPHIKVATKLCLRIIRSLASCIRSVEALWSSSALIGSHFCSSVISTLRALCEKSNECRDPFLKVQLFLLISTTVHSLLPRHGLSSHLPAPIPAWLCTHMIRPDFYYLYDGLIQPWYDLCAREFPENKELDIFKSVLHIKSCLTSALDFVRHEDTMPVSQSIQCLFNSLPSLYYHRDVSLVRGFMRVCSRCIIADSDDLIHTRYILLSLLSCSDTSIQLEAYSSLDQCVQSILKNEPPESAPSRSSSNRTTTDSASCRTNASSSIGNPADSARKRNNSHSVDGDDLLRSPTDSATSRTNGFSSIRNTRESASYDAVKRLRFLLDTEVLIELICQGARSSSEEIRSHSRSILQSLLSARVSVTMETWLGLLRALSPVLCLLQCLVPSDGDTDGLGTEIIQLTHPDLAKDIRVSKLQIVKSNACLLYHRDSAIRLEATARLAWSTQYSGAVTSTLADLCVTECHRSSLLVDVYEESSVTRVLDLLTLSSRGSSSPDEEARVRFSCLTQLGVMMDDVKLHRVFIESGGVTFVVRELHELLNTKLPDWTKRKQSIGCCVRILRNVCENNSSVRQHLCSEYTLLVDVIKVLFQFDSCHSDVVQLLFILLYADFVLNSDQEGSGVSVPAMVRENLHVPEPYSGTHWTNSPHTLPNDTELLLYDAQCKQHLSIHWNLQCLYAGDIHKMLRDELSDTSHTNIKSTQVHHSTSPPALTISRETLKLLRRASVVHSCSTSLQTLQSTSSYSEAYTAVSTLQRYLDLQHIENAAELDKLPFSSVLHRYLEPAPSSVQDQQLLLLLLGVVQILPDSQLEWVSDLLVSKQTLLALINPLFKNLTHHSLLCVQLFNTVRRIILAHPSCVHAYGSLTQSALHCVEQHSQMESPLLIACLQYLSDVFYLTQDTRGLDTEVLWQLLASVPLVATRVRSDLVCKALVCLDLVWSSKLNDSVALGVWLGEVNFSALRACLSPPVQSSVKAVAYHLLAGLCYTRGSVASVVHNIPGLVDGALSDVLSSGACDLEASTAALVVTNIASFSSCEILLQKCIDEDFFLRVIPILSNPRSSGLKSAVCSLVNNLFNLNPRLLAQTNAMVQLVSVLINELVKNGSTILNDDVTEYCTAITRILTQYYNLSPELPTLSDKFHTSLIYLLNASSYDRSISISLRDTLWQCTLLLLSSLPLPPPLPPTVASTLCYCLRSENAKTARSILATLPKLVPQLNPDNLEALCHVVFSAWSRRFKPCSALLNATLALTAGQTHRGPGPLLVLEYDLLEDVHVRLKQFYVSLECSHGDSLLCAEMDIYLQLLNNILAQDSRVAEAAAKLGLADTLHKLLGWVLSSESTLICLLQVLTTFTARCIQACTSCVHTSTLLGAGLSKSSSSSSLVHSLISLAVTASPHNSEVRVRSLAILSHLAASNECRLVESKSSLFDHFTDAMLNKKLSLPLETAWIKVLKSYSLHLSQFNNPIDNVHFLDTLIDKTYRNLHYLIPLTNLSFQSVYQTKLSAHEKFLKLVNDILVESDLISLNRCAKSIRAKLSEDFDGAKEDIRSMNEKLFQRYFELLLFDNTVNRRKKLNKLSPNISTNSGDKETCSRGKPKCSQKTKAYSQSSNDKSDDDRSGDGEKTRTKDGNFQFCANFLDGVLNDTQRNEKADERLRDSHSCRSNEKEISPSQHHNPSKRKSYEVNKNKSDSFESGKRHSHECYENNGKEIDSQNKKDSYKNKRSSYEFNKYNATEMDNQDKRDSYNDKRSSYEFNKYNATEMDDQDKRDSYNDKRSSYEFNRNNAKEIDNQEKTDSYESYRNRGRIVQNEMRRTSTLEKYAKLLKTKSETLGSENHISKNILGVIEANTHRNALVNNISSHRKASFKANTRNALANEIARILDMAQAFDTALTDELNRVIKRNAVLVVWNLSANNYKMKLHFKHVGLVGCLQNALKCDTDFAEEYACVIDMLS